MYSYVTESELDEWVRSHSVEARGLIPELIQRLVAASSPNPLDRRFHCKDSIGQHGPDGILEVDHAFPPFIPDGKSYWEIGVGLDPRDKASSDYADLVSAFSEEERAKSTFIFVTPLSATRTWEYTTKPTGKITWIEERKSKGEWKDVRVIDGTKLIDWLNQFEPVGIWLRGEMFGDHMQKMETAEQRWNLVRLYGDPPPLTPDVFIADRQTACENLKRVFDGEANQLNLTTHFPDQVADFVAAYVATLEENQRLDVVGRCLLVHDPEAWGELCSNRANLILVAGRNIDLADASGRELIQKARRGRHAVVFGGPPGGIPDPTSTSLPSPRGFQLKEALVKAGYHEERARTLSQKSAGNLGALLRCLQNLSLSPDWAQNTDAADLAIANLLGSWSEGSPADLLIVERASGKTYGEWIEKIRAFAFLPGTPLIQKNGTWRVHPRYEAWYDLGPRIFDDQLDRVIDAAKIVLSENNPALELDTSKRFAASIFGKTRDYSESFRQGLSGFLALLGSHPKGLSSCTKGSPEVKAALTIRHLLGAADWQRWASLNDELPLLAEAAPSEFLDAIDRALSMDPCPFDRVFKEESSGIGGQSFLTGLLWALETLAWDQSLLTRVVLCLGELDARDPGGNMGNRPGNSLRTILLPWLPQTTAPSVKRIASVSALLQEVPESGWKLLVGLLPNPHSFSNMSRRPAWRECIPVDFESRVTNSEYWVQISAYADLAIAFAKSHQEKLPPLIKRFENLPPPAQDALLDYLRSSDLDGVPEVLRQQIWNTLSELARRHRKYSDTAWALNSEAVDQLLAVASRYEPNSNSFRLQHLFGDRDFDLLDEKTDFTQQLEALDEKRRAAIHQILESEGIPGLLQLVEKVDSSWRVGLASGFVGASDLDDLAIPSMLESADQRLSQFASAFVVGRFHSQKWPWFDDLVKSSWTPHQIGLVLSFLPFHPDTWNRASILLQDQYGEYWTKARVNPFEPDTDLVSGVRELIKFGRPDAAIQCLGRLAREGVNFDTSLAIEALLSLVRLQNKFNTLEYFEIGELIQYLQDSPSVNPDDLFKVEWSYISIFEHHLGKTPKVLWRRLSDHAETFCLLVTLIYNSSKDAPKTTEPSDEERRLARNAYECLRTWKIPPGLKEDGTFDGALLDSWMKSVTTICAESGHLSPAMIRIGHVLTYVPPDPGGLWIDKAAANILNARESEEMREGFSTEIYNSRGVHWVDPTGAPERALAKDYSVKAEALELAGYVRLASTLRQIANSYLQDADRITSIGDSLE